MSRQVIVIKRDDFDASLEADDTIEIVVDGVMYIIDLTSEHMAEFRGVLDPYLAAAHHKEKASRGRQTASADHPAGKSRRGIVAKERAIPDRALRKAMRSWAQANGHAVGKTGILSKAVQDAYHAAHEGIGA